VLYGWAIEPYKSRAFYWESVNAAVIVSTVAVTEILDASVTPTAHAVIFGISFALQVGVRPYSTKEANLSVGLFTMCELFGALGEFEIAAFQWIYVVTFLLALIVAGKFAISALVKSVVAQRHELEDHLKSRPPTINNGDEGRRARNTVGEGSNGLDRGSKKTALSMCERTLVAPFLFVITVVLVGVIIVFACLSVLFKLFARCARNSARDDTHQSCTYELLDAAYMGFLGLIYAILHTGSSGEHRSTLDSFRVGHLAERYSLVVWAWMMARAVKFREIKAKEQERKGRVDRSSSNPRIHRQEQPGGVKKIEKMQSRTKVIPSTGDDESTVVTSDENTTDGASLSLQEGKEEVDGAKKQEKWTEVRDPSTGKTYFHNSVTGVSSWTDPRAIAPKPAVSNSSLVSPWTAKQDPASGKTYYYNSATNETSWARPLEEKEAEEEGPTSSELRTWGTNRKASKIIKQSSLRNIDRAAIIGREQQF
jgi:hypothetical protein